MEILDIGKTDALRPPGAAAGMGSSSTFAVVGEVEQQGLEAAGAGPEQVPDDFTEQDHRHVVLHLKTASQSTIQSKLHVKGPAWCSR